MLGPTLGGALFELGGFPVPFWVCGGATLALALATCLLLDQEEEQEQQGGGDVTWAEILRSPGRGRNHYHYPIIYFICPLPRSGHLGVGAGVCGHRLAVVRPLAGTLA